MSEKPHTIRAFDEALRDIDLSLERMGQTCLTAVDTAMQALSSGDASLAQSVIDKDKEIDDLERQVTHAAMIVIAQHQPVAIDLRHVAAAMKIAGDLERVGDLAKNTARRAIEINGNGGASQQILGLQNMSQFAASQLRDVMKSYHDRDAALAKTVWSRDLALDEEHQTLYRSMLAFFMMQDPRSIDLCTSLIFVAKNIERIGDHATNIAEKVYELSTGDTLDDNRPKIPSVGGA